MNRLELTSMISRNPDVAYTQIDQEMVMLEPENVVFCTVNPMGTVVWRLLESTALSLTALFKHIHQHYAVAEKECIDDVTQYINEMVALNLLRVTSHA